MKKLSTLLIFAASFAFSIANAQSLSIIVEPGQLRDASGSAVAPITDSWSGYFGFVSTGTDLTAGLGDPVNISLDYLTTIGSISWTSLITFDNSGDEFFLSPNAFASDPTVDITTSNSDIAVGQTPVILMTNAISVGSIAGGSQLVLADGAPFLTVNDNRIASVQAGSWSAIAGLDGSLQAGTVVPEPSTFALFAGIFGLGFVVWRRRK